MFIHNIGMLRISLQPRPPLYVDICVETVIIGQLHDKAELINYFTTAQPSIQHAVGETEKKA